MPKKVLFPNWIINSVLNNEDKINKLSKDFFNKSLEDFPHFNDAFLNIPTKVDIGILKSYEPRDIQSEYGFKFPIEFILLNIYEQFHFHAIYQLRELGLSFIDSLNSGGFYVAALLNRAMFEVVLTNYYTFINVEAQLKLNLTYLDQYNNTRSVKEKDRLLQKYYEGSYEIFSNIFDANSASSINWSEYLLERFNFKINNSFIHKKIHINDAIRGLEKVSGLPLMVNYSYLSEFVHPNAGSKMLIVNTKTENQTLMDKLTLGDNNLNPEAALFFVDHFSESLYYTLTLALTFFSRSQKLILVLDKLYSSHGDKNSH